jgi:S-adenosylmethionine decarboxylase
MNTLGRHLLAEFYACDRDVIDDIDRVAQLMREAAERVGATVVAEAFHRYEPQGVSGTLLIAESHLSVHTWPEVGYVAVDIFTCGGLDPRPGFRGLSEGFRAGQQRMHEVIRGLPDDLEAGRALLPKDVTLITRVLAEAGAADEM